MIPFISGRKRMLKYHSSLIANGLTPRVIGCSGIDLKSATQCGLVEKPRFVISADPVEELVAGLALGHLDRVVQAGKADALVHQLLEGFQAVLLDHRMTAPAVHEEDDRPGTFED